MFVPQPHRKPTRASRILPGIMLILFALQMSRGGAPAGFAWVVGLVGAAIVLSALRPAPDANAPPGRVSTASPQSVSVPEGGGISVVPRATPMDARPIEPDEGAGWRVFALAIFAALGLLIVIGGGLRLVPGITVFQLVGSGGLAAPPLEPNETVLVRVGEPEIRVGRVLWMKTSADPPGTLATVVAIGPDTLTREATVIASTLGPAARALLDSHVAGAPWPLAAGAIAVTASGAPGGPQVRVLPSAWARGAAVGVVAPPGHWRSLP